MKIAQKLVSIGFHDAKHDSWGRTLELMKDREGNRDQSIGNLSVVGRENGKYVAYCNMCHIATYLAR